MLDNATNLIITGGTFIQSHDNSWASLGPLLAAVVPNAFHNADARYDPPRCHPETRVAIRDTLHQRVAGNLNPWTRISFLYGPAGSGKSAILQTMAEECLSQGRLLAGFFLWKSDNTRNHTKGFVATICYQIIQKIPRMKAIVSHVIENDPFVLSRTPEVQMRSLIIEPLQCLQSEGFSDGNTPHPTLIVVDGIDECIQITNRQNLLHIIAHMIIATPVTVIVSSRPEVDIRHVFNHDPMQGLWHSFVLDSDYQSNEDIRRFLVDSFQQIKSTHPYAHRIPILWPEDRVLNTLVFKASGQFIFASVVIKYISPFNDLPHRRLEVVMGLRPANRGLPFAELDEMYSHLLNSHPDIETALIIIAIVATSSMKIDLLTAVLNLELEDVELSLDPLCSVLESYRYKHSGWIIRHASFKDFLLDKTRSKQYFIGSMENCRLRTAQLCLDYIYAHSNEQNSRDDAWDYFLHAILEPDVFTDPWNDMINGMCMDKIWPLKNASTFYKFLHEPKDYEADRLYRLVDKMLPILQEQVRVYLLRPRLTATLCLFALGLHTDMQHLPYLRLARNIFLTYPDVVFDFSAFDMRNRYTVKGNGKVLWRTLEYSASNGIKLLRKHFNITFITMFTNYLRRCFVPSRLHVEPICDCCYGQYYGIRSSKNKPRQWRSRRVYRQAGIKTYKYKIPYQHDYYLLTDLYILPTIFKECSLNYTIAAFIQQHRNQICTNYKSWRQEALQVIQEYIYRSRKRYSSENEEIAMDFANNKIILTN